jgi:hypothetical protein
MKRRPFRLSTVLLALVAMACSSSASDSDGAPRTSSTSSSTTTTTTRIMLSPAAPYRPLAGEPVPELKQMAADALQSIATYDVGGGTVDGVMRRLAGQPVRLDVTAAVTPFLLEDASSELDIVYPQLGGLTTSAASMMVVVRHRTLVGDDERAVIRTVDVRLEKGADGWTVSELASTGGEAPATSAATAIGETTLANPNLDLSDTARWDIQAGRISDPILDALNRLASERRLSVTVLATGHPHNVFGAESVSNHTAGRGVDIWAVDGTPVIDQRSVGSPAYGLVEAALAQGMTEVGSPWDLDGAGTGASFTNTVHQDHLHFAYDGPSGPESPAAGSPGADLGL